jgi:hypothetical protein
MVLTSSFGVFGKHYEISRGGPSVPYRSQMKHKRGWSGGKNSVRRQSEPGLEDLAKPLQTNLCCSQSTTSGVSAPTDQIYVGSSMYLAGIGAVIGILAAAASLQLLDYRVADGAEWS